MAASLETVERRSLSDAVFEQLRDRIVSGVIEPGERLPPERELCEMLGVNRNALREALKRLEQARLVSIRHGGATRALDFRSHAGPELLTALLVDGRGRVDTKIARGVIEMRVAIGRDIIRLAATRRAPEHAEELRAVMRELETGPRGEALQEASKRFWDTLVVASDNLAYRLLYNTVMESTAQMSSALESVFAAELRDREGQRRVVEAVVAGDADAAERAALDHLEGGATALLAILDAFEASYDPAVPTDRPQEDDR